MMKNVSLRATDDNTAIQVREQLMVYPVNKMLATGLVQSSCIDQGKRPSSNMPDGNGLE